MKTFFSIVVFILIIVFNWLWWQFWSKRLEAWMMNKLARRWQVEIKPSERYKGTWQMVADEPVSFGKKAVFNTIQILYPVLTLIIFMITLFLCLWLLS